MYWVNLAERMVYRESCDGWHWFIKGGQWLDLADGPHRGRVRMERECVSCLDMMDLMESIAWDKSFLLSVCRSL
jgi:hypothetical protein